MPKLPDTTAITNGIQSGWVRATEIILRGLERLEAIERQQVNQ